MSGGYPRHDEVALMRLVLAHGRIPRGRWGTIGKREAYILAKWAHRGWWEYGALIDCGRLTNAGREALPRAIAEAKRRWLLDEKRSRVSVGEVVGAFATLAVITVVAAPFAIANKVSEAWRRWREEGAHG